MVRQAHHDRPEPFVLSVFPASSAPVLQKGIGNSKVIIMKDCGHVPMIERPEETAQYYLEFIS
jgi:pimeloyl-ACP methyl ester carboxylesterase